MRRPILPSLVRIGRVIRAQIFRTPVPEEVDEEFAFHVEMRVREFLAEGRTLEEARAAAIKRFGDIAEVKAICRKLGHQRDRRRMMTMWCNELLQDVRFALRQLRSSPGMALAAILTLALGIGANTAVFSVVNGVILSPLPFPEPQDLVEIRTRYLPPSGFDLDRFPISVPELVDYREAAESFDIVGLYTTVTKTLTGPAGDPELVPTVLLDRNALEALGVEPQLGRWFSREEDQPRASIGLIGHDLWVTRFGADPSIVGTTLTANGNSFLVTGVMPPGFEFPSSRYQIFENYGVDPTNLGNRESHGSYGIGRLGDGITMEQVRAESESIHAGWAEQYPHNVAHFPIFESLADNMIGTDVQRALIILMGSVAVVLLIAAANVANLLLARGENRQHELAVRTAMGATRVRIVRQFLTENLTLSALGGLLGIFIGIGSLRAILSIDPGALPRAEHIELDGWVLLFTGAVTVGIAILFGLAPTLQGGHSPANGLGTSGKSTSSSASRRFRRILVTTEVALSLVVVVAAGLLTTSLRQLRAVDPGVDVDGRLVFSVSPTGLRYRGGGMTRAESGAAINQFFDELQTRLAVLPGVASVSGVSHLPLSGSRSRTDFLIEGRGRPTDGQPIWSAQWTSVLPNYFETMGIEPVAGRLLDVRDQEGSESVVVISEATRDTYFRGEDPIGARVGLETDSIQWARIVGVVPLTRTTALDAEVIPQVYYAQSQGNRIAWVASPMFLTVRTVVPPEGLIEPARAVLREIDSTLPMGDVATMEEVAARSVARPRLIANLLGAFALVALLLAAVGIYGVVSYSVSRRTREVGIRLALGAQRATVAGLMLREGASPALLGVVIGILGALGSGRVLSSVLYEVSPRDPVVFAVLPAVLLTVAVVSSYLPARRASRLDPTEALREE